jgi:hypothetical protein
MKRFLLVFLLAAALLGLLAAPAFAEAPWAPTFRLPVNTAYVFTYLGGSWFSATGDPSAPTLVAHWTTFDDNDNIVKPADPIPANYDICMQLSWKGLDYGLIQKLPTDYLLTLSIPQLGVDLSRDAAKAYWTGPYLWDQYWVDATGIPILGFNPNIGAQPYANRWLPPLTGDKGIATMNLTTDKKLAQGIYHVNYSESVVQSFTNLELMYDDQGDPLPTQKPTHTMPYTSDPVVFTFTVGPPV